MPIPHAGRVGAARSRMWVRNHTTPCVANQVELGRPRGESCLGLGRADQECQAWPSLGTHGEHSSDISIASPALMRRARTHESSSFDQPAEMGHRCTSGNNSHQFCGMIFSSSSSTGANGCAKLRRAADASSTRPCSGPTEEGRGLRPLPSLPLMLSCCAAGRRAAGAGSCSRRARRSAPARCRPRCCTGGPGAC